MKQLFILFIICISLPLFAQNNNMYWVRFKDKSNNQFTISNPQQFLSPASIARRTKQNISINESDLPITTSYIDSLTPHITKLVHRLNWFNIVVVKIDNLLALDTIRQFAFVDSIAPIAFNPSRAVEQKFELTNPVNQTLVYPNKYGIAYSQANMLNVDLLHQLGYSGQGITIAMMDNGYAGVNNHAAFDSAQAHIRSTWDFVNHEPNVYNDGGHGTNTLSCIAANLPNQYLGTAPQADYLLYVTEDDAAEWIMEEYNWAAAAQVADSAGAQIFSTSLGYTQYEDIGSHTYADLDGHTTVITNAGNYAFSKGILVINSAGNEGQKPWRYIAAPADGDSVLAIGAVDSNRIRSSFSSYGPNASGQVKPNVCAQGSNSAVITVSGDVAYSSGTSFSCPIIAGAAACLWNAFPNKSARDIFDAITISADNFSSPDSLLGYGIPNFYNAYLFLKTNYNPQQFSISQDVLVYPNPFSSELNISMYGGENKNHTIEIFNLLGQKVYSNQLFIRTKTFEILKLNGAELLPAGKYVLRLDGKKEFSHTLFKF